MHKYESSREHAPDAAPPHEEPAFENLGELPQSYGSNTLYLVARDPHWLFSYWDIEGATTPALAPDGKFFLKVFTGWRRGGIHHRSPSGCAELVSPGQGAGRNLFRGARLLTPRAATGPAWPARPEATAPQDKFSDSSDASFATVPIHLTFQRMMEMVQGNMIEGESLIMALSRLQGEGRKLAFQTGRTPEWTEEQRQVLAAFFGAEIVERLGMGSAEIDQLLRQELLEKLSTESASELVAKSLAWARREQLVQRLRRDSWVLRK